MPGLLETLISGVLLRGVGPALAVTLMAAPLRKVARAQLKKIYVLNETGDMAGEYVLDPDCPIDYNDFLKVLPDVGIGDREALFVGEYVFTLFQSGKVVFVLLSRGQLSAEDIDWTALLLTAADSHLAQAAKGTSAGRAPEPKLPPEAEKVLADREGRLDAREKELAKREAQVQAELANVKGRDEELARQKDRLTALADYVAQMEQAVSAGVSKATQALDMSEQLATSSQDESNRTDAAALAEIRTRFDEERRALVLAKDELETKYREASEQLRDAERKHQEVLEGIERERKDFAVREAEQEKLRSAIEVRVQELSQRFAQMAKERLMTSHEPGPPVAEADHAQVQKERKFLQRRAIELLDREERVRDQEMKLAEREGAVGRREEHLNARIAELEQARAALAAEPHAQMDLDEARKDIERRVKIIQQKALDLLDREEKLRKRAAELEALEARFAGKVPAN
jgi:uncharacterized protein (DUF3084 family)